MAEPVWISSSGAGVTVMEEQPLFYSWNQDSDNKLCLSAEHTEPYVGIKYSLGSSWELIIIRLQEMKRFI